MPLRPLPALGAALGAVLLVLPAVAGCSRGVQVAPAPQAGDPACARAAGLWPDTVGGAPRVETRGGDATTVAWGDPAVVARCGVPSPAPTTDPCVSADGVDWLARELTDGVALTTYGRSPAIEVLVPAEHGPAPLLAPAFTEAAKALPTTGRACV